MAGELHPLLNPVILAKLFEHCPPDLLANCRLVCKIWRDLSLANWRSSSTVQLVCPEAEGEENNAVEPSYSPLQDFLRFVEGGIYQLPTRPLPCRQVHLQNWDFGTLSISKTIIFDGFRELLGTSITTLRLSGCVFTNDEGFRRFIYRACPNLQMLTLEKCSFPNSPSMEEQNMFNYADPLYGEHVNLKCLSIHMPDRDKHFPVSWLELFSHFPDLTSLKLSAVVSFRIPEVEKILGAIKTIKLRDRRKLPLKEFDVGRPIEIFNTEPSREMFDDIGLLELPLQSLDIHQDHGMDEIIIKQILERHCKTLIEIRSFDGPSPPRWNFPFGVTFVNLQFLYISDGFCEDVEFLKYTPNLKVLNFIDYQNIGKEQYRETKLIFNTWEPELADVKLSKLEELDLDYVISVDDLRCLVKWLPNVQILGMPLNDKQFAIVCENWRKLVRLHVHGQDLSDEGVIGMRIRPSSQNPVGEGILSLKRGIRPNISSLTYLETFYSTSRKLTDVSIFHGFLNLKSLHRVFLYSQIGDEARRALRDNNIWIN